MISVPVVFAKTDNSSLSVDGSLTTVFDSLSETSFVSTATAPLDPADADLYYVAHQRSKGCDCDLSLVADGTGIDASALRISGRKSTPNLLQVRPHSGSVMTVIMPWTRRIASSLVRMSRHACSILPSRAAMVPVAVPIVGGKVAITGTRFAGTAGTWSRDRVGLRSILLSFCNLAAIRKQHIV